MKTYNKVILIPSLLSAFLMSGVTAFAAGTALVDLGTADAYVILSESGISTVPSSAIIGNIGVSPIAATAITGFDLVLDRLGTFSKSPQVTGKVYAATYTSPTPANLTTAVGDMRTAYTDAATRAPDFTELGGGEIGGLTLAPGVYKWGSGVTISTDVALKGKGVYIFQIAGTLSIASAKRVILQGGARAKNIFWQVAGSGVTLGTTSHFEGIILSKTLIAMQTGATINGRLLAQTAVTLDQNAVRKP